MTSRRISLRLSELEEKLDGEVVMSSDIGDYISDWMCDSDYCTHDGVYDHVRDVIDNYDFSELMSDYATDAIDDYDFSHVTDHCADQSDMDNVESDMLDLQDEVKELKSQIEKLQSIIEDMSTSAAD